MNHTNKHLLKQIIYDHPKYTDKELYITYLMDTVFIRKAEYSVEAIKDILMSAIDPKTIASARYNLVGSNDEDKKYGRKSKKSDEPKICIRKCPFRKV